GKPPCGSFLLQQKEFSTKGGFPSYFSFSFALSSLFSSGVNFANPPATHPHNPHKIWIGPG
ncbi:MAG: hypothetical protein Q8N93_06870, partial [Bacillota bacterium]|nr:hypothetical protein [Bacillota bacterium]